MQILLSDKLQMEATLEFLSNTVNYYCSMHAITLLFRNNVWHLLLAQFIFPQATLLTLYMKSVFIKYNEFII